MYFYQGYFNRKRNNSWHFKGSRFKILFLCNEFSEPSLWLKLTIDFNEKQEEIFWGIF